MERWSFQKYKRPYLAVESIQIHPESKKLTLVAAGTSYEFAGFNEQADLENTVMILRNLQSPDTSLWKTLTNQHELTNLIDNMDCLNLIRDTDNDALNYVETEIEQLEENISIAATWLLNEVKGTDRESLKTHIASTISHFDWLLYEFVLETIPDLATSCDGLKTDLPLLNPFDEKNFYILTLLLQGRYWRRSAPVSLICSHQLLWRISHAFGSVPTLNWEKTTRRWREILSQLLGGVYELKDVYAHLKCLVQLLVWSTHQNSLVLSNVSYSPQKRISGINFILEAEKVAKEVLNQLGPNQYLTAISQPEFSPCLVMGRYIEEYHVNRRFVEIITPMMAKRLQSPLREKIFQYYAEEVGHEAYELKTCHSLGINEEELNNSLPLPLHLAFVDIFTYLAEASPIGYLISIFVTEGMFGEPFLPLEELEQNIDVNSVFEQVGYQHKTLDMEYNHSSLSRMLMSEVPFVSEITQKQSIKYLVFLLELNHRLWDNLYEYYNYSNTPMYHHWFNAKTTNN